MRSPGWVLSQRFAFGLGGVSSFRSQYLWCCCSYLGRLRRLGSGAGLQTSGRVFAYVIAAVLFGLMPVQPITTSSSRPWHHQRQ
jgi:hypothetical protein